MGALQHENVLLKGPLNVHLIGDSVTKNGTINEESGQKTEKWPEKWPEKAQQILDAIAQNPTVTIAQLEHLLKVGHTTVKKLLQEMQKEKFIRRIGADKGGHWEIVQGAENE